MIEILDLKKTFGTIRAVDGISFSAMKGELCGILGPNGSGKTTLFKTLMGLLEADSGTFRIADTSITYGETDYKSAIGYAPEEPVFFDYLTGRQFLNFICAAKNIALENTVKQIEHWLAFFDLTGKGDELIAHYSQGMRRKLSLSAALLGDPALLILDEATNGLDPESSFRIKSWLREYCNQGGAVLFSTHIIEIVEHLCDRIIVLYRGQKLAEWQRSEWQAWRQNGTSLEAEFMRLIEAQNKE